MVTLVQLPKELIQYIHLLSLNPLFPLTSSVIYNSLHRTHSSYIAQYLLSVYSDCGPTELLVRSLRHPVCDLQAAKAIKRIWNEQREAPTLAFSSVDECKEPCKVSDSHPVDPQHVMGPLLCCELPRRLFRKPAPPSTPIHSLVRYLFDTYAPSANSHKGYPLCRAVLQSNHTLAKYLLQHGADPRLKDHMALEIAISMKDLVMVKILIERDPFETKMVCVQPCDENLSRSAKRIKLGDRIVVNTRMVEAAMKKGANDIVNYLVYDKKVIPPLKSIMNLGETESTKSMPLNKPSSKTKRRRQVGFR
nr:hypothetical protein L203_05806 [Cryptococcus depauperatus CBS 7841]